MPSKLRTEYNAQDALDLAEPLRIEGECYFDHAICRPRCGEFHQMQPKVPSIAVGLVRLDLANTAILALKLALNEEVRPAGLWQVEVCVRVSVSKET